MYKCFHNYEIMFINVKKDAANYYMTENMHSKYTSQRHVCKNIINLSFVIWGRALSVPDSIEYSTHVET